MKNIAIIGSGDLAKQVISLIHESKQHTIYGIYDDVCKEKNVEEYKLKGGTDWVRSHYSLNYFDYICIAVGYKRFKYKNEIYHRFKNKVPLVNIIHKSCIIHSKSVIGEGILMFPNVVVDYNAVIEDNVVLNISSTISNDSKIKKNS